MHTDHIDRYRRPLLEDPPSFQDRVDSPWTKVPDLGEYNAAAYQRIVQKLKQMKQQLAKSHTVASQGILVLGEAGSGKTHLLMRIAQNLSAQNHILFIRQPANEDTVAQHVWHNMLESLNNSVPGLPAGQTQLDALLSHVFSAIFIPALEKNGQHPAWVRKLRESPDAFISMLGQSETPREKNIQFVEGCTLQYLQKHHPEIDSTIARMLMHYCLLTKDYEKQTILAWLDGQQIRSELAAEWEIDELWGQDQGESDDLTIRRRREELALKAIRTIAVLSVYYQPLIMAFDQLEGLRGEKTLTRRWCTVVREIFTMAPNLLILTCIFPDLWRDWFQKEMETSTLDRIAQHEVALDVLNVNTAKALLALQLQESCKLYGLPDAIYPFTAQDVEAICETGRTPRSLLNKARRALEDWLYAPQVIRGDAEQTSETIAGDAAVPVVAEAKPTFAGNEQPLAGEKRAETGDEQSLVSDERAVAGDAGAATPTREQLLAQVIRGKIEEWESHYSQEYKKGIAHEADLFGKIQRFTQSLIKHLQLPVIYTKAIYGNSVMPLNCIIKAGTDRVCIAICNQSGTPLAARIKNLEASHGFGKQWNQLLFLRDYRSASAGQATRQRMEKLASQYGCYLVVNAKEFAHIYALYDALVAVQQQDLALDDEPIRESEFFATICSQGILWQSSLYCQLFTRSACLQERISQYRPAAAERTENPASVEPAEATEPAEAITESAAALPVTQLAKYPPVAGYPRNLRLPDGDDGYLQQAASAVQEEYQRAKYYKRLCCKQVSQPVYLQRENIYILETGEPLDFEWTWEGSKVWRPENMDDGADPERMNKWGGEVVEIDEIAGHLYVAINGPNIPCTGGFYLEPFDFFAHLDRIYNDPSWRDLKAYLPALLNACAGIQAPSVAGPCKAASKELQQLWQHTWSVLWGPPGTGKTYRIGEEIGALLEDPGERFLIVSTTNKATDEAALALGRALERRQSTAAWKDRIIRVGRRASHSEYQKHGLEYLLHDNEQEVRAAIDAQQQKLAQAEDVEDKACLKASILDLQSNLKDESARAFLSSQYRVVITTAFNAISQISHSQIYGLLAESKGLFTTLFIDEASMVPRAAVAALALLASRRVILVGDPKQLSPIISQVHRVLPANKAAWLAASAIDCLNEADHRASFVMLTQQYRMHPQIRHLVSQYQYGGKIGDAPEVELRNFPSEGLLQKLPRAVWYVLDDDTDSLAHIRADKGPGNKSRIRARTQEIMDKIFHAEPSLVRVKRGLFLSPFVAQVTAMAKFFKDNNLDTWEAATIHRKQGAEADFVILDTVSAGDFWSHREWQRLINVGISRAREFLLLMASRDEMQKPCLAMLQQYLDPRICKRTGRAVEWKSVPRIGKYEIAPELQGRPELLGNQIRMRKAARPILSAEQQTLCDYEMDGKPRLVRGVAGSGKTLVLAHWLVKTVQNLPPDSQHKIWIIYANKSLKGLLEQNIESAWQRHDATSGFPWERVILWHIYDLLYEQLLLAGMHWKYEFDYDAAASAYLRQTPVQEIVPLCRCLFLDEAQDLGPSTLRLLFALVEPEPTTLSRAVMIFYDNAQNIYERKLPNWKDLGIELRGRSRSTVMKESFRSTRPLCEFALNVLYRLKSPESDPDHHELVARNLIEKVALPNQNQSWWRVHFNQTEGPLPIFQCRFHSLEAEIAAIGEQLVQWIKNDGVTPGDIRIIYSKNAVGKQLQDTLSPRLSTLGVQFMAQTGESFVYDERTILATTVHSFKGYDSEILVIAGVDQFQVKEKGILANLLYVAMTRARSVLAIYGKSCSEKSQGAKIISVLSDCMKALPQAGRGEK